MEDSSEIKIRLLLRLHDGKLRKFYWFERKANDFYWGSSIKSGLHLIPFNNVSSVTFQIPEDFDLKEKVSSKFSYHSSGTVHHKTNLKEKPKYDDITKWCTLNDITDAKGFFAVISKDPLGYEIFTKAKPTSGGTMPIIFNLPNYQIGTRFYFEFILSPFSDISKKEPLIKINGLRFHMVSVGINEKMFLIIRCAKVQVPKMYPADREIGFFFS